MPSIHPYQWQPHWCGAVSGGVVSAHLNGSVTVAAMHGRDRRHVVGMYHQVFSRLLWKDGADKETPDLAESWEMAKDGLSFTLKLRQGVKWHDGKDFTDENYVTQFNCTRDEGSWSRRR